MVYGCSSTRRSAPVTSAMLEEKANLAALLGNWDFKATNGQPCRWKSRNGIKVKKAHREKDADINAAELWSSNCAFGAIDYIHVACQNRLIVYIYVCVWVYAFCVRTICFLYCMWCV